MKKSPGKKARATRKALLKFDCADNLPVSITADLAWQHYLRLKKENEQLKKDIEFLKRLRDELFERLESNMIVTTTRFPRGTH